MRRILLSFGVMVSSIINAQYSFQGNFEDPGFNTVTYKQFGGGTRTPEAACTGSFGGQLVTTALTKNTGYMVDLSTIEQVGNGQKVDVSVSYKKQAGVEGTLQITYFKYNPETEKWSVNGVGETVTLSNAALTNCNTISATIPAGVIQPDEIYGIGAYFRRSGTTNAAIYLDDINIQQENVTDVPACTAFTFPQNNAVISGGNVNFMWNAVSTAVKYKVSVGTAAGLSDVYAGAVVGTDVNITLGLSQTYYASVIPVNMNGEATGCSEITFSTNDQIDYCHNITSSLLVYPITSVSLAGKTHTSAAETGTPAYEDFSSTVFDVTAGSVYDLTVLATGLGSNRFGMTVFVDWNNDGDFHDAGEIYYQRDLLLSAATLNTFKAALRIPENVSTGTKRMRIKYNFNSSSTQLVDALTDPCADMTNGQTEDFTLSVTIPTDVPACTTINDPIAESVIFPANGVMKWNPVPNTLGYKIYVGTTPGGTDIVNGTTVPDTSVKLMLVPGQKYYAKVVPYNVVGDAEGCTEIAFTAASVSYCFPQPGYNTVEPISNVTFAGINNTSSATINGAPAYEDFTSVVGDVVAGNSYDASFNANTSLSSFRHFFAVYIDWNQDGDFDDEGEKYFVTPESFIYVLGSDGVTGAPATGTITVPADAKPGNTRMRVKSAYYGAAGPSTDESLQNFANACTTLGSAYGQIEDYTIHVENVLSAIETNSKSVKLYPNPVHDLLNVSDHGQVRSIMIFDLTGRLILSSSKSTGIDFTKVPSGLYIVNLILKDGKTESHKIIKK